MCAPRTSLTKHSALSPEVPVLEPGLELTNGSYPDGESVDIMFTRWGERIFDYSFGALFGHWVGRNGCPFMYV